MKERLEDAVSLDLRQFSGESCALAAAINIENASRFVYDCLVLQEHRGEKSSGIVSVDNGRIRTRRSLGLARNVFRGINFEHRLPGRVAIGHNRYATAGDPNSTSNIQPLTFPDTKYGFFAIAHNGTLVNSEKIRDRLIREGVEFKSTTDSELFGHLIARSSANTIEDAIVDATSQIPAAYSFVLLTQNKTIALRDRYGVRPLSIASLDSGYLLCSENYAFDQFPEAVHLRDVLPGEMIVFEKGKKGFRNITFAQPDEHFCIFEGAYFSNPRTRYNNCHHEDFRQELGKQLAAENPGLHADCIIPILDSGKHAAIGLEKATGIPYKEYFLRIHNPPNANVRSFTSATYEERARTALKKLHLRTDKIQGKRIITMDDSIVRDVTIKIVNERLRKAGAAYIINCISMPPIVDICPNGMDFQTKEQLAAARLDVEGIRKEIGADELIYLSLPGLAKVVERTYRCGICSGCFGGRYPIQYE